ncbi:hypothetical protein JW877_01580 [bacterium]|nr:hypothetical protein [bacterium]
MKDFQMSFEFERPLRKPRITHREGSPENHDQPALLKLKQLLLKLNCPPQNAR